VTEVDRLLAYEEIRQLVARYALYMDSRNIDALVELFVPDVRVGRDRSGRDALRADFEHQLRGLGATILFVGNHVIDLDGDDAARGVVYCRGEIEVGDRFVRQAIVYEDDYARREGAWRFVRRRHLLFYGVDAATNPRMLEPANWPEHHTGVGTLPERWESWRSFHAAGASGETADETADD
jgi:hypothetical protein